MRTRYCGRKKSESSTSIAVHRPIGTMRYSKIKSSRSGDAQPSTIGNLFFRKKGIDSSRRVYDRRLGALHILLLGSKPLHCGEKKIFPVICGLKSLGDFLIFIYLTLRKCFWVDMLWSDITRLVVQRRFAAWEGCFF